jgi:hypothetical protein
MSSTEMRTAMKCARKGYAFLTEHYNGHWQPLIDLKTLVLADGSMCILGQLPLDEMANLKDENTLDFTEKLAAVYAEYMGIDFSTYESEDDQEYSSGLAALHSDHMSEVDDFGYSHGFMAHNSMYSFDERYPHKYAHLDIAWRILLESESALRTEATSPRRRAT